VDNLKPMKADVQEKAGLFIITPHIKRLDVNTCDEFKKEVVKIIQEGKKKILLNLSHIDFIDSRGLGSLISIFKTLSDKEWLGICEPTSNVMSLFKLTRMDRIFDIYSSEEEAFQKCIDKTQI
jgi:anti-sigma B factor antagonist